MADDLDLVSRLDPDMLAVQRHSLCCVSPDDAKYSAASEDLVGFLSADAEWRAFALVQEKLMETRVDFHAADARNLEEVSRALESIDPVNMALLEAEVTHHDQLAVIEEIGRFVSPETKALLHPGTTSYDVVDTARAYLFKRAWIEVIRPRISESIEALCDLSERSMDVVQVGRTHLQRTSPVLFGGMLAGYAARLAERVGNCDRYFDALNGKVSGIVGTGASIDMVIGTGSAMEFEKKVLEKLGLEPDLTATQVVQKEALADVGHGLTTLMHVLGDFANDVRLLYSSEIGEVTSRDNAARLGGSSADATKNNPIQWENMAGKATVVESGMRVLYEMISTDLQRDLRGSVMARYQPQPMMVQTYEAFSRLCKALPKLSVNDDIVERNLQAIRDNPGEAMVAILRGERWVHPTHGVGHTFVKEMGKEAKARGVGLLEVALEDPSFRALFDDELHDTKKGILQGKVEDYVGFSKIRAAQNRSYAQIVCRSPDL